MDLKCRSVPPKTRINCVCCNGTDYFRYCTSRLEFLPGLEVTSTRRAYVFHKSARSFVYHLLAYANICTHTQSLHRMNIHRHHAATTLMSFVTSFIKNWVRYSIKPGFCISFKTSWGRNYLR